MNVSDSKQSMISFTTTRKWIFTPLIIPRQKITTKSWIFFLFDKLVARAAAGEGLSSRARTFVANLTLNKVLHWTKLYKTLWAFLLAWKGSMVLASSKPVRELKNATLRSSEIFFYKQIDAWARSPAPEKPEAPKLPAHPSSTSHVTSRRSETSRVTRTSSRDWFFTQPVIDVIKPFTALTYGRKA